MQAEYAQAKQKIDDQAKTERSRAKKAQEETRWQALAMYEAGRDGAVKTRKKDEETLAATRATSRPFRPRPARSCERCAAPGRPRAGLRVQAVPATEIDAEPAEAAGRQTPPEQPRSQVMTLQEAVKQADEELLALEKLKLPSFLRLQNFFWPFLLLARCWSSAWDPSIGWTVGGVARRGASPCRGHRQPHRPDEAGPAERRPPLLSAQRTSKTRSDCSHRPRTGSRPSSSGGRRRPNRTGKTSARRPRRP